MKRFSLVAALAGVIVAGAAWGMDAPEVYTKKCELCHSVGGKGGKKAEVGGKLDGVGAKRDDAWLRAYIADPKSKMPDAKMPKFKLSPEEMDSVVTYILSLK